MSAPNQQISPGMIIAIGKSIFRVESSVKVTVTKGTPFIKTKLKDLVTDEVTEKNFKIGQKVQEVTLNEKNLEFLYPEGKDYLFLDVENLEKVLIPAAIISDNVNYLKEGTPIKAKLYGDSVFSIELPQFLELMVIKADSSDSKMHVTSATKKVILETGATIEAPLFVETGDILKVDPKNNEFIQRV
jgi:elongation factor P